MKKLILGCGYLGQRVAQAWLDGGDEVIALTRSSARMRELESRGIRPIIGDVTSTLDLSGCVDIDTVLFAVGFDRTAGNAIHDVYVDGLRRTLDQLPEPPQRLIYISSTGVFSQNDGNLVDEQSVCEPTRAGGKACLAAEELLRQHSLGARAIILRLAGIYGPGRLPKLQDLVAGKPLAAAPNGFLNLIHVEDAVRLVLAAEQQLHPPEMLLVSDGQPVLRADFYRELARLTNSPAPSFEGVSTGSTTGQRASTDKRIDNKRLREQLSFTYRYPSFVEGLAAIVAGLER